MGVYLYCVTDAGVSPPEGLTGLDGAPVGTIEVAGGLAWTGRLDTVPRTTVDRVKAHNGVAQAALEVAGTVVPIRYGQLLADEGAVRRHMSERDGYSVERDRVRDCVEFAVRVLLEPSHGAASPDVAERRSAEREPESGHASATPSGTAYLKARARELRETECVLDTARELAGRLNGELAELVRESRTEVVSRPAGAALAHLVQRGRMDSYATRAQDAASRLKSARAVVTGPWPPYSFVDDRE